MGVELGLPQPPKGHVWIVRRWDVLDYEFFPYPRAGKVLVALAYDYTCLSPSECMYPRKARALRSVRSIRKAAFRILARHEREERSYAKHSLANEDERRQAKQKAQGLRDAARESMRNSQVVEFIGTYPPKKVTR